MKTTILTVAMLFGALIFPTLTFATTLDGCEIIQAANGNYWFKADPACVFDRSGAGERGDGKPLPVIDEPEAELPESPAAT